MGNAPNAVVPLPDYDIPHLAEVYTVEVQRRTQCCRCKRPYDVLWLQVRNVRVLQRVPVRAARKGEHVPTTEVPVHDPAVQREAEQYIRKMLDRPANAEHGGMTSNGWCCNGCLKLEKKK